MHSVHKMWPIARDRAAWPVSVGEPYKNDWTDRDAIWGLTPEHMLDNDQDPQ